VTLLKQVPKVDRLLGRPEISELLITEPRPVVVAAVRMVLDRVRRRIRDGLLPAIPSESELVAQVREELAVMNTSSLRRVVNGTGVVIHTNLGRSLLPVELRDALCNAAFNPVNLEFDLEKGERGSRNTHLEPLICELTGAEAALVVNNNAAAVLLALASLAAGREVVVSRGELVEIGGSFRVPEVMKQSGVILHEVGTTNRTHPADYRNAITCETALLLKVHPSNFAVTGFTAAVSPAELASIGGEFSLPVMADVGSGNLINFDRFGLPPEPTIKEYIQGGVDVVTFSGDKLLGGPQAGIIAGKKCYIDIMKKHPLLRALRVDKFTIAALDGVLRLYRDERQALAKVPTLKMLTISTEELARRGGLFVRRLRRILPATVTVATRKGFSQVGGGAFPTAQLPTTLVSFTVDGISPHQLEERLRKLAMPVVGFVRSDLFLLDIRTIQEDDLPHIADAFQAVAVSR